MVDVFLSSLKHSLSVRGYMKQITSTCIILGIETSCDPAPISVRPKFKILTPHLGIACLPAGRPTAHPFLDKGQNDKIGTGRGKATFNSYE